MNVSVFRGKVATEELIGVFARLSWLILQELPGLHGPLTAAGSQELLGPTYWPSGGAVGPGFVSFPSPESNQARGPRTTEPQLGHGAAGSLISTLLSGLCCFVVGMFN